MVAKRGGLGRNLSALLSHTNSSLLTDPSPGHGMVHLTLPASSLQPGRYQPRREIDDHTLSELAESIKQQGLIQPLVVREISSGRYEIIAGERRWRACQMVDMIDIPVILRQVDDETAMAMALIENLQREDLNAMDQAHAMHRLVQEFALTHQQIADLLCKSRAAVSNYLRLLNLNGHVQRLLEHGDLDMGHARCLLMLDDAVQTHVADLVVSKQLSVRETEALVARTKAGKSAPTALTPISSIFSEQLDILSGVLKTKVNLRQHSKGYGTLVIHYEDTKNLETVMGLLLDRI